MFSSLQLVHMCLVVSGEWRWSRPFSIDSCGLKAVQVYVGTFPATLHVRVSDIGGLQKMVTLYGGWQFSSLLPFPLEVQVVGCDLPSPHHQPPSLPTLTLPPSPSSGEGAHVPSVLAADSHIGGVRVRKIEEEGEGVWSRVYPMTSTTHEWSKPQLLAELNTTSGKIVHFWFNVRPVEACRQQRSQGIMVGPLSNKTGSLFVRG